MKIARLYNYFSTIDPIPYPNWERTYTTGTQAEAGGGNPNPPYQLGNDWGFFPTLSKNDGTPLYSQTEKAITFSGAESYIFINGEYGLNGFEHFDKFKFTSVTGINVIMSALSDGVTINRNINNFGYYIENGRLKAFGNDTGIDIVANTIVLQSVS